MNPEIILPIEQCHVNLKHIQGILDRVVTIDAPVLLLEQLNDYGSIMGMSAHIQSSLKFHLETHKKKVLSLAIDVKLSPSIFKEYISSECAEYLALYEMAERQNRALVHASEGLRTIISYQKQEMALAK